jgi:hypothetical protein
MTQDLFRQSEDLRATVIRPRNDSFNTTPRDVSCTEAARDKTTTSDETVATEREGLRQRVRLFLATSHIPTLRHVDVEIDGDVVLLRGKVRSYYEKQMALQFASRVAGVIQVVDSIEVRAYVPLARLRRIRPEDRRKAAQAS